MQITDFSLRNMRTFCAVVENQGFSGAQAILGMSQPAISIHIKDLETTLGFRLCQRGRGGFILTGKGEIFYKKSKQILGDFENYKSEIGELKQLLTGTLTIGFIDNIITDSQFPFHKIIAKYWERDPKVEIKVQVASPDIHEKDLLNNSIQLAIGPFRNFISSLTYEHIYDEKHSLYCGTGNSFFNKENKDVTLSDIAQSPLVVRSYLGIEELKGIGAMNSSAQVSNMETSAFLIRSGKFVGYLPDHFAKIWVDRGEMRAINHLGLEKTSPFYLAMRCSPTPPKFVRVFKDDIYNILKMQKLPK